MDAIETERLTVSYGAARGIVDLDLRVPTGTVFGFLGPNGAGKTTTIRLFLDFLRPSAGVARVLGLDSRLDSVEIRRRVGYLPGDPALYERLTGRELLGWLARMRAQRGLRLAEELAARFRLDLDRPIRTLSRGNRQKVALVQAFMHEPELLLLDEPTSGLDPLVQYEFHELVHEVVERGATVFLSSHVLDEVQHLCDHVGIVRDGRLIVTEAVASLRARAVREVTIRFAAPVDANRFAALHGVRNVVLRGTTMQLHLSGSADPLVKLASEFEVLDLSSAPPDLDELFMQYYEDEGSGHGAADH